MTAINIDIYKEEVTEKDGVKITRKTCAGANGVVFELYTAKERDGTVTELSRKFVNGRLEHEFGIVKKVFEAGTI